LKFFFITTLAFLFYFPFGKELSNQNYSTTEPINSNYFENSTAASISGSTPKYTKTTATGDGSLLGAPSINYSTTLAPFDASFLGAECSTTNSYAYPIGPIVYVKETATGSGNGSDWDNAFGSGGLEAAVESGGTIYVAEGTYIITDELEIATNTCLQGGFPSNGTGTDTCFYDPIANPTVFDGQTNERLINNNGEVDSLVLKGLILRNGSAENGSAFYSNGTSILPSVYQFIDLVVESNVSITNGAFSIANKLNLDLKILFQNCLFQNNVSDEGGGIHFFETENSANSNSPNNGNLVIENCDFVDNIALIDGGGAISLRRSNQWTFKENTFCDNTCGGISDGGAIRIFNSKKIEILDSDFTGNNSLDNGGAIFVSFGEVFINNCDFLSNSTTSFTSTTYRGGAIFGSTSSGINIVNSNFYLNSAASGGAIYMTDTNNSSGDPNDLINCTFVSNQALIDNNLNASGGGAIKGLNTVYNISNSYFVDNMVEPLAFGGAINNHNSDISLTNNLFYNNTKGGSNSISGSDIIAVNNGASYTPMQDNKMQLSGSGDYLLQNGTSNPASYDFTNDTFSNTDDGSLPPEPSITCSTGIAPPVPSAVCIVEICNNGIDDDGNGLIDCADEECCCAQAPTLSQ